MTTTATPSTRREQPSALDRRDPGQAGLGRLHGDGCALTRGAWKVERGLPRGGPLHCGLGNGRAGPVGRSSHTSSRSGPRHPAPEDGETRPQRTAARARAGRSRGSRHARGEGESAGRLRARASRSECVSAPRAIAGRSVTRCQSRLCELNVRHARPEVDGLNAVACSPRSRARRPRPRRPRRCTSATAEERTRADLPSAAGFPARGRPPPGRRQSAAHGWAPSSACAGRAAPLSLASRARSSHRNSSSPAAGGRISAAIRNPPGRRSATPRSAAMPRRRAGAPHGRRRPRTARAVCPPCAASQDSIRPSAAPDHELVDAMRAALVHRGRMKDPRMPFGRCVLGHQRLRVIDLETGYQPVSNEGGERRRRLQRRDLQTSAHCATSSADTTCAARRHAVLPHLYEEESGVRFVERVQGMFALACGTPGATGSCWRAIGSKEAAAVEHDCPAARWRSRRS